MSNSEKIPKGLWVAFLVILVLTVASFHLGGIAKWTLPFIVTDSVCGVFIVCVCLALISQEKFWWAPRIITASIFVLYSSYLIYEFWIAKPTFHAIFQSMQQPTSEPSPYASFLGFCAFGVPSLFYTLWGSVWGPIGDKKRLEKKPEDVVAYKIAIKAQQIAWHGRLAVAMALLAPVVLGFIKKITGH